MRTRVWVAAIWERPPTHRAADARHLGAQSRDFEAAEEGWTFFRNKHAP
jgi:hypothetical protein